MWDQVDQLKMRAQHNKTNLSAWRQFMTSVHSAYASFGQHLQEITDTLKEQLEPKVGTKDTKLEELHTIQMVEHLRATVNKMCNNVVLTCNEGVIDVLAKLTTYEKKYNAASNEVLTECGKIYTELKYEQSQLTYNRSVYTDQMQALQDLLQMAKQEPQLQHLNSHNQKIASKQKETIEAEQMYQKSVQVVNKLVYKVHTTYRTRLNEQQQKDIEMHQFFKTSFDSFLVEVVKSFDKMAVSSKTYESRATELDLTIDVQKMVEYNKSSEPVITNVTFIPFTSELISENLEDLEYGCSDTPMQAANSQEESKSNKTVEVNQSDVDKLFESIHGLIFMAKRIQSPAVIAQFKQ